MASKTDLDFLSSNVELQFKDIFNFLKKNQRDEEEQNSKKITTILHQLSAQSGTNSTNESKTCKSEKNKEEHDKAF
jgi:hypothetical protein